MKRKLLNIVMIILFLLYGSTIWANGIPQYRISKEKIESARVVDNKDGSYSVVIQLKEPYKKELAKITSKNIGKKLRIIFRRQVLIEPIIRDQIDSGIIIIGDWKSAEDALKFIDTLYNNKLNSKKDRFDY